MMETLRHAIKWRLDVIRNSDSLISLQERLLFASKVKVSGRTRLYLNHIKEDGSGTKYIGFGKCRIYYDLDIDPTDNWSFMSGIVDTITESLFYPPPYFSSDFRPKSGDIVFDIGASIGSITLVMSKMVGDSGRVYSFEPATFMSLQKNISANHLENCTVIPKAVSNTNGQVEIRILDSTQTSSIMMKKAPDGRHFTTRTIESITLDSFVESNAIEKVDFIKMDIEGAEEVAILGACRTIERFHPKWSIASYHHPGNEPQHPKLVKLLRDFGYRIEEKGSAHIFAY